MPRWAKVVAVSLFVVAAGMSLGLVSQRDDAASLTPRDYIEIEQLYMAYAHTIDFGESGGRDYAALFVPDGVFALVIPNPIATAAPSRCRTTAPWHAGDTAMIRGSVPAKAWLDVCIATLNGSDDLAKMAEIFHQVNGTTGRHVYTNLRITPAPEGTRGFVYWTGLDVSTKPPRHTVSGIYEHTLVRHRTAVGSKSASIPTTGRSPNRPRSSVVGTVASVFTS